MAPFHDRGAAVIAAAQLAPEAASAERPESLPLIEARLLNARRFQDWLDLYAPDAWYWVPLRPEHTDPKTSLSHLYEDRQLMEARILRLIHPHAWTLQPAARSVRVVSDVHIVASDPADGRWETAATFVMVEYRKPETRPESRRIFAGTMRHGIRRYGDTLRLAWKRVDLVDCEGAFGAVTEPL